LAFARPLEAGDRRADDDVIAAVLKDTGGYPFHIQFFGALLWDAVPTLRAITLRDFQRQRPTILRALDHAFFDARLARTSSAERRILRAIAAQGEGASIQSLLELLNLSNHGIQPLVARVEGRQVVEHLGGLDLGRPRPVHHPVLPELPDHLPVLVQAYADPVDLPWVALHGGRVFGTAGRWVTRKHRRPAREVYRLRPHTKVALQMYVEDRVLEGFWVARRRI